MVTNRASGSADQADGTTQRKMKINRERSRLIWIETCKPVPQPDGVVRHSGRSEANYNFWRKTGRRQWALRLRFLRSRCRGCQARNQSCKNVQCWENRHEKQNGADLPGELYWCFELAGDCAGLTTAKLPHRRCTEVVAKCGQRGLML